MRGKWRVIYGTFSVVAVVMAVLAFLPRTATAAINQQIHFQGKLTNPDGTNVTNGSYSIRFRIYTHASADAANPCLPGSNSCKWEDTQSLTVTDGIFSYALGSNGAAPLPGSVDFNVAGLHIGIKVGTDAEMTPRVQLTAAPYAFNSNQLGGIASTGYVQLGQSASAQTDSSTNAGIFINKTGASGNIFQLQKTASDVFIIGNTGNITATGTYNTNTFTSSALQFGATSAASVQSAAGQALTLDSGTTGAVNIATSANAKAVTIGNATVATTVGVQVGSSATAFTVQGPSSAVYLTVDTTATDRVSIGSASNGVNLTHYLSAGNQAQFVANAAPTADMVSITNAGQAVTTAGVSGLQINYVGGNAAVESSAARVDLTPGATAGGVWNGLRIIANATGAVAGVTENGIKLEGPATPGAGTEVGLSIDADWDAGLQIGSKTTDPAAPPTDSIYVYARKVAGRSLLRQIGSSGVSFAYQPSLFEQAISYVGPNTGTTATSFGSAWAVDTTLSHPAATEAFGYAMNFATNATNGDTSGISQTNTQWFRGSTTGSNGFFYVARVGTPDAGGYGAGATGSRIWSGLTNNTAATMTSSDNPANHYVGFQYSTNRGDANWQFMTKDGATQNLIDTTMAFAASKVYDFYIYTPPQGASVYWRIDNLTDGTTVEGTTAANLPGDATAMRAVVGVRTLTGTARNIRVAKIYVEADR